MFKKIFSLMFALLIFTLFTSSISQSQTVTKDPYPLISISPLVGVHFPVGGLNDVYNASWNAGLDITLRVNKETAFYLKGGFYNMPRKGEVGTGPNANYIEITAGPRYVFSTPNIKANFFLEAGLGMYIFNTNEYTLSGYTIASTSTVNFGVNAGPGVIIPLSKSMDLIMKAKLHYTFESGGSHTFIAPVIGLDFKL